MNTSRPDCQLQLNNRILTASK